MEWINIRITCGSTKRLAWRRFLGGVIDLGFFNLRRVSLDLDARNLITYAGQDFKWHQPRNELVR